MQKYAVNYPFGQLTKKYFLVKCMTIKNITCGQLFRNTFAMTLRAFFLCAATWVGVLFPSLAMAQWIEVDSADPATFYADPQSAQKVGSLVKMWELVDYHEPQVFAGEAFFSTRVLREFDCSAREMRTLAFTIFTKPMAGGSIVHSHRIDRPAWQLVEPYSVGESSYLLACRA